MLEGLEFNIVNDAMIIFCSSKNQRIGASPHLAGALNEIGHSPWIIPNLISVVIIPQNFRRNVRDNISVVDNPERIGDLRIVKLSKVPISHSRLTESVHCVNLDPQVCFEVESADRCEGASQTVPCYHESSIWIFFSHISQLISYEPLNIVVCKQEPSMHCTSVTKSGCPEDPKISNPIFNCIATPEGNNNRPELWMISNEAKSLFFFMEEGLGINCGNFPARVGTIPLTDILGISVCNFGVIGHIVGNSRMIGISRCKVQANNEEPDCQFHTDMLNNLSI